MVRKCFVVFLASVKPQTINDQYVAFICLGHIYFNDLQNLNYTMKLELLHQIMPNKLWCRGEFQRSENGSGTYVAVGSGTPTKMRIFYSMLHFSQKHQGKNLFCTQHTAVRKKYTHMCMSVCVGGRMFTTQHHLDSAEMTFSCLVAKAELKVRQDEPLHVCLSFASLAA